MNRIILIGNGFDLAHGLETKYEHFIDWFWKKTFDNIRSNNEIIYGDDFIRLKLDSIENGISDEKIKYRLKTNACFYKNEFLRRITGESEFNNWVDIEEEYYTALKNCINGNYKGGNVEKLNQEFEDIKRELKNYLMGKSSKGITTNEEILDKIYSTPKYQDCIRAKKRLYQKIDRVDFTLFLNFNYTHTESLYSSGATTINIHGELNNSKNPIIFGYGDEQDTLHKEMERRGGSYLDNVKTVNYLKTPNYKNLMSFIEMDLYQVFIMGHSCGLSDKTLLSTLFEHEHCISIKPFFYIDEKGHNNYEDIVKNIYRIFTGKAMMREKVVNKEYCEPLIQLK